METQASALLLTIPATGREFGISQSTVRNLVKQKRFPVVQMGTRIYIARRVFENFISNGGALYDSKQAKALH